MPDPQGRKQFFMPLEEFEEVVVPSQRRVFEQTGKWLTDGLAARRLIKLGAEVDSSQESSHLSSTAN